MHDGRSPESLAKPAYLFVGDDVAVLGPGLQVFGGKGVHIELFLKGMRCSRIYPQFISDHYSFRVGILPLEKRVRPSCPFRCFRCTGEHCEK